MRSILLSDLKGVDKKTFDTLKKARIKTLEDLKLSDTAKLSKQAGLSETLFQEILFRAELRAYGIPPDIADALESSGAIHRAGELCALEVEEIRDILKGEVAAKRAKISSDISMEGIAAWKERIPRLTLDELTPVSLTKEEEGKPAADEDEHSGHGEDLLVSSSQVAQVIRKINDTLRQEESNLKAVGEMAGGTVEFSAFQEVINSICEHIKASALNIGAEHKEGEFVAAGEEEAPSAVDEDVDTEQQIQQLSLQMIDIERQMAYLQQQFVSGDEELNEPAAAEEEFEEPRGEEENDD